VASPNPEGNKDHDNPTTLSDRASGQQHGCARKTSSLGETLGVKNEINSANDQHRAKEESYWNRQVFWQRVTACAAIAAFAAAAYYGFQAKKQVAESIKANTLAHENAVEDLRAYINVGGGPITGSLK
jgi:anti-sigma-K factor RskA